MNPLPTVLIIEDDATMLRGIRDNFASRGFEVRCATDGGLGLATALDWKPQLILLDIMLPRINGLEVCRQLRKQRCLSPIIMLSAKGQESDIVRGLEEGADDYVTKPFSIRELVARAHALLRRTQTSDDDTLLSFGPFVLDRVAHELCLDGQPITLTTKEFQLLEFFLARPHRALTRREIIDHVWGNSVIVTARSVDRCVTTLRGKIEADSQHPRYIHTIRDVGYRFTPSHAVE